MNLQIPEPSQKLSNLQLELLRMYSHNISEEDLLIVKDFLARYFADRSIKKLSDWADKNHIDDDTLEKWLNEKS